MLPDTDLESIRKDYRLQSLLEKDVDAHPIFQFESWWKQAIESRIDEPNAMTLATSTLYGKPSARIVLLKGIRQNGFVFYSNYHSRKGKQIEDNPFVSLVFFLEGVGTAGESRRRNKKNQRRGK